MTHTDADPTPSQAILQWVVIMFGAVNTRTNDLASSPGLLKHGPNVKEG